MIFQILDYNNNRIDTPIDTEKLDNISSIAIRVLTGDEVAIITYKDGTSEEVDSIFPDNRSIEYFDEEYIVYQIGSDDKIITNLFNDDDFMNRESSYWNMDLDPLTLLIDTII